MGICRLQPPFAIGTPPLCVLMTLLVEKRGKQIINTIYETYIYIFSIVLLFSFPGLSLSDNFPVTVAMGNIPVSSSVTLKFNFFLQEIMLKCILHFNST